MYTTYEVKYTTSKYNSRYFKKAIDIYNARIIFNFDLKTNLKTAWNTINNSNWKSLLKCKIQENYISNNNKIHNINIIIMDALLDPLQMNDYNTKLQLTFNDDLQIVGID